MTKKKEKILINMKTTHQVKKAFVTISKHSLDNRSEKERGTTAHRIGTFFKNPLLGVGRHV